MIRVDPYLLVRAASLYLAVTATIVLWAWRRPAPRGVAGAVLACCWNLPIVLGLNVAAAHEGWWRFDGHGGLLLGMPVDLYLSWILLWGAIPALAFPSMPMWRVMLIAIAVDLAAMPAAVPVVRLGPMWLAGEGIGLILGLLPAQLLARWTMRDVHLERRAFLQIVAFTGLLLFVLPAIVIEASGSTWVNPTAHSAWRVSLLAQLLMLPAVIGLTAVQEFVTRGGGTPVPFDAPRRLVTTGVYAYIGNPMQLSAVVLLVFLGLVVWNPWLAAAGVMAHLYSAGLAGWDEDEDLRRRFGDTWTAYRRGVRRWVPRLRPWHRPDHPPARLYVSARCNMCREVARWFERRDAKQLAIVPAETHPSQALRRITYEPADGSRSASGIDAVARALEHVHLGWASVGFVLRLPIARQLAQLLADASGAEPRTTSNHPSFSLRR
jgi:protein-S-isoprenylcysteine O-methyltransferase Ste14/predicted DCC family thiol-disulfide oxidoreductase YuxK